MAIEHLLKETITEVGKIKCGGLSEKEETAKSGRKYRSPVKYDHWVVTTMLRDKDERLIADAGLMDSLKQHAEPDGKLRRIPVVFMSNDLSEIMSARYVTYVGKRAAATSDGLTITEFMDKPGGKWLDGKPNVVPFTPEIIEWWKMKLATTLNVMIQSPASRWGGLYRYRTTSRISADQLFGSLKRVQMLTGGILRGVPFWLVLRPMTVSPEGKTTTIYVAHCEVMGEDIRAIRDAAMEQMKYELANVREVRAIETQYLKLLAHETDLDDDEIPEFFPSGDHAPEQLPTGELVTAGGEIIEPPKSVEQPPVHPPATPEEFVADGKAFAKLVSRKGSSWKACMEHANREFETSYDKATKFGEVEPLHLRGVAEWLLAINDAGGST